jgi:hypothetical protein
MIIFACFCFLSQGGNISALIDSIFNTRTLSVVSSCYLFISEPTFQGHTSGFYSLRIVAEWFWSTKVGDSFHWRCICRWLFLITRVQSYQQFSANADKEIEALFNGFVNQSICILLYMHSYTCLHVRVLVCFFPLWGMGRGKHCAGVE